MNPYLLLILLTSWSLLVTHAEICDTGVAFANSVLSMGRSTLANADVALLKSYNTPSVEKCLEECCAGKYGSCSVASFKKNATNNCIHFYCRPLKQCKFVSSSSADSFTFSSEPHASHPVPSSNLTTTTESPKTTTTTTTTTTATTTTAKSKHQQPQTVEEIATFSNEQPDLKNDNTSIKPRKGVTSLTPDIILSKSGIKPRKGVTLEDVPHSKYLANALNKSNVKPRKGVKTYSLTENFNTSSTSNNEVASTIHNSSDDTVAHELESVLAKMFEDDPVSGLQSSTAITPTSTVAFSATVSTFTSIIYPSQSVEQSSSHIYSSYDADSSPTSYFVQPSFSTTPSLRSSSSVVASSSEVPKATITSMYSMKAATSSPFYSLASEVPLLSARAHLSSAEPKSVEKLLTSNSEDNENNRKYKSSIHLVLSLIFGLLVLFAVLGVVAKRMYDGWQRRDYYRMNYLIDGIYNGYE